MLDGEVVLHHGATDVATFDLSEILRAADVCLIAEPVFIPTARCMLALASKCAAGAPAGVRVGVVVCCADLE